MQTNIPGVVAILTIFSLILMLTSPSLSIFPVLAAPIFEDGFESGGFGAWTASGGTPPPTVTAGNSHHGDYKAVLDANDQYFSESYTARRETFGRAYFYFQGLASSGNHIQQVIHLAAAGTSNMGYVNIANVGGVLRWQLCYRAAGAFITVSSTQQTPTVDHWYCVELQVRCSTVDGNFDGEYRVWINGSELTDVAQTGVDTDVTWTNLFRIYMISSGTNTMWVDCAVLADSYIGPEDLTPPNILITSPSNTTYATADVPLTCTVDEPADWMGYSLDGHAKVTLTGNTTLTGLSNGSHHVTVYANDTAGNMGASPTVYFTVQTDITPPAYATIGATTTLAGTLCTFHCYITDDVSISSYIFSTNHTGTWLNDTAVLVANPTTWANVTTTLTDNVGAVVGYRWYANDTSDNWSSTPEATLTVTAEPRLTLTPTTQTCRMYGETYTVQITVADSGNADDFAFELHYNTTLLDVAAVTWDAWGSGTYTDDDVNGILTGATVGTPLTGAATLLTVTFTADYYHVWKSEAHIPGWRNLQTGIVYLQWANLSYPTNPDLSYVRDGLDQITVGPEHTYIFDPIRGDLDNDGTVGIYDLVILAAAYDTVNTQYDLTGDDYIDIYDLVTVATNYGFVYTP